MSKKLKRSKNYIPWVITGIIIIVVVVLSAASAKQNKNTNSAATAGEAGELTAEELSFDFGKISMANGKVSREIKIKNNSDFEATVTRLSTSCMCTTAELSYQGKRDGPFGMPGHGFIPSIKTEIQSGDEATLKVVFDPAARGPAGVGTIKREIYLEQEGGKRLTINFSAFVTP